MATETMEAEDGHGVASNPLRDRASDGAVAGIFVGVMILGLSGHGSGPIVDSLHVMLGVLGGSALAGVVLGSIASSSTRRAIVIATLSGCVRGTIVGILIAYLLAISLPTTKGWAFEASIVGTILGGALLGAWIGRRRDKSRASIAEYMAWIAIVSLALSLVASA